MQSDQLVLSTMLLLFNVTAVAETDCLNPVKPVQKTHPVKGREIVVQADQANIQQDSLAEFAGKVEITSSTAQIKAEQAKIDKQSRKLDAQGNIQFQDKQIKVNSDDVSLDLDSRKISMSQTKYRMLQFQGRGAASNITLDGRRGVLLEDVSFSTCPEDQEDWRIEASSIEVKSGEIWGTTKHTRFYVKDVPVLYLPYFSFPVTDLRHSGLLFPRISSSSSTGLSYEQPIYWNIAPNYDATITPRLMTNRGLQLKNEFRYLTEDHRGNIHFEYMNSDSDFITNDSRYFYRLTHQGELSDNWSMQVEVNGLSDDNYIVDLGSDFYNRADTHLFKTLAFNYYQPDLQFSASFKDFEVIGDHPNTYRALPELILDYNIWQSELVNFRVHSELAYFNNGVDNDPKATRLHIEPILSLPYQTPWGEFLAETRIMHTHYQQSDVERSNLSKSVDRTLGQIRLYGSVAFERETSWWNQEVTQTLEPKVQYLYTSFDDQSKIGFYDTARLRSDFDGLFRGQEFTGLDRISDKNQLTLGVTSRIIDENNQEQFRVSLGQIFYFDDNRVVEASKTDNRSAIAAELDWNITSRWFAHGEIAVAAGNEKVERSNTSVEYRISTNKLVQLSHRYVRDLSGERVDQVGITASWDIAKNWQWVGRYYRDLDLHRTTESYTGVQYESCCWSLQLVWQRHLSNRFDALGNQSINEYESGIGLKFAFKGMGQKQDSRTLLNDGLYGYRRPYLLNN
ncbi:MAG: LPS-assembly protein LptD [Aestuariibacter sp.]